nr:integrase, catalytic region, zinc finger, CCHC-type, peptidase aspartic, catalytic [Tanacetum cinerariifolium]
MLPPPAQVYSPPKKDLSWTGIPEFADDTVTDYSRPSPAIESTSDDAQNRNPFVPEIEASPSTISSKPFIKFVKAAHPPTVAKSDKKETIRKPSVKYAEQYKKPSKTSNVRINQRNWNNLKSQQLGENFVMKNRACFNCCHFDHLSYNCGKWVDHGRSWAKNKNTHKSMPPRPAIHKPNRSPMRPTRPNTNAAPRSNVNNARPKTTQDLMIILIQRVKRLERELKERTPHTKIHKVDRGISSAFHALIFPSFSCVFVRLHILQLVSRAMEWIIYIGGFDLLSLNIDKVILSGADNRPPMLEKDMYDSWKSRRELYMLNRQHGRMILESVEHAEAIQADCNVKATNIILQGLPPEVYALVSTHKVVKELWERIHMLIQGTSLTKQEKECKLCDEFDKFATIIIKSVNFLSTNDIPLTVNHNAYMALSSAPQIDYALIVHHPPEFSSPETGLVVLVFQKGDDPIDAINHMMSFLTAVVTS